MHTRETGNSGRKYVLLSLITSLLVTPNSDAGRPLTIDDAGLVARGEFELEAAVSYSHDGPLRHWDFPLALAYGAASRWEIGVASGGQLEERAELESDDRLVTGLSDVVLGTKLKFADQENLGADHAAALSLKLPTTHRRKGLSTGEVDYDLTWIASRRVTEKTTLHLNIGYTWLTDPPRESLDDLLHYGFAITHKISDQIELVAEVFANTPPERAQMTDIFVNGGLRWQAAPNLVLDAAVGAGIRGETPDITATFGFTWAFGLNR